MTVSFQVTGEVGLQSGHLLTQAMWPRRLRNGGGRDKKLGYGSWAEAGNETPRRGRVGSRREDWRREGDAKGG